VSSSTSEGRLSARADAQAVQAAALPAVIPQIAGFRFSALYSAGRSEAIGAGDWYDAMRLVDGRIVVSVGDVSGGGVSAAATMGEVRQAIRGAAQIHPEPLALLEAADRILRIDGLERMVTAFVGVLDPITFSFAFASAGHPPAIVCRPDGSLEELRANGLPLGYREKSTSDAGETYVGPGSLLVLFTDGLIEGSHDIVEGERRLKAALESEEVRASDNVAAALKEAVLGEAEHDDVAILTLFVLPRGRGGDEGVCSWSLHSDDAAAARELRRGLTVRLRAIGASDDEVRDAELVFSELIANVVRHAHGPVDVALDLRGPLPVLSVLDRGPGFTRAAHLPSDVLSETGRGLFIVNSLCVEFNADRRAERGTHARAVLTLDRMRRERRPGAFFVA
jgi:anti-sigma regulatory factor (Ser/Thr protein kinase)